MSFDLESYIYDVPNFPSEGIIFKDITPLLSDSDALNHTIDQLVEFAQPLKPDYVIGTESRGFILGGALASKLECGLLIARKPGRLPRETVQAKYELEYGSDVLELHSDSVEDGSRILIHDDLLATGGTARATESLVKQLGAEVVGLAFIVELSFLEGRRHFGETPIKSLIQIDDN